MSFDIIIVAALAIATVVGYFKGIISQFFSVLGIVLAYFLSAKWAAGIEDLMRDLLPFTFVIADMFARLVIGIVIFLAVKFVGKFFEFIFGSKVGDFATFNRWGGFFFGLCKSILLIFIVMAFVTLVPSKIMKKRFPSVRKSATYRITAKYNPVIHPKVMENMRKLKDLTQNYKKMDIINNSVVYNDYLKTKEISNPFKDSEIIEGFQKGDVAKLRKKGFWVAYS